jgi:gamma-glutamylcyclotransferase (GGCT)/AIG2-like uncharacterized protein YtfP
VKINLFVYGTLRPGQYNSGIHREADRIIHNCTTPGEMRNLRGERPIYPVVDFTRMGTIVGDLLIGIDSDSDEFAAVDSMEKGAGYTPRFLMSVITTPDREAWSAISYHWPHFGQYETGVRIKDGDWLRFVAQQRGATAS